MNLFFVIGDTVVTPELDGTILRGITRDSFLVLLKGEGYKVEERRITVTEMLEASKNGQLKEVFGSGTAAVVAHVDSIQCRGTLVELPAVSERKIGPWLKKRNS